MTMKKLFWLFVIVVMAISMTAMAEDATFSPWDGWRQGYETFQKAEKLVGTGELKEALLLYKESRDLYLQVQKARPDWNQNVIKSRLELCEKQIAKIESRLASKDSGKTSTSTPPVTTSTQSTVSSSSTNLIADDEYKKKYFELFIEVENLRKQLRTKNISSSNVEALLKEKQQLEENYNALNKRYQTLKNSNQGVDNSEFDNVQKLLIAEKLKSDNAEKRIGILNNAIKKMTAQIQTAEEDLKRLQSDYATKLKVAENVTNELTKLNDVLSKKNSEINSLKSVITKNLSAMDKLNASIQKNEAEITKLNRWIDELQAKNQENLSETILAENRKLKLLNEEMGKKYSTLQTENKELSEKVTLISKNDKANINSIAALEEQKKATLIELANVREQYLRQLEAEKLDKAALEKLKTENKKNYENLNLLIAKNEELNLKLNTKSSSEELNYKEIQKIQDELEKQKNQAKLTIDSLQLNIQNLEEQNKKLIANNDASKSAKTDNYKKFVMSNSEDYEKLQTEYKALKEKYEFLSLEIESLSKPVAEISETKINSDEELKNFLQNAASEAIKSKDANSAAWYYEELLKQDEKNLVYTYNYLLYSALANKVDLSNANDAVILKIQKLDNTKEKSIISGIIALKNQKFADAEKAFKLAKDLKTVDKSILENANIIIGEELDTLKGNNQADNAINSFKNL